LFAIIFIIASAQHFNPQTIASAARHSVPLPHILVPLSGVIALVGGLCVLIGYRTRFGAWLLVIFLVPVTLMMHNFWAAWDPATTQIEKAMFMKNLTMIGGALIIGHFGAGPLSVDAMVERAGRPETAHSPAVVVLSGNSAEGNYPPDDLLLVDSADGRHHSLATPAGGAGWLDQSPAAGSD